MNANHSQIFTNDLKKFRNDSESYLGLQVMASVADRRPIGWRPIATVSFRAFCGQKSSDFRQFAFIRGQTVPELDFKAGCLTRPYSASMVAS